MTPADKLVNYDRCAIRFGGMFEPTITECPEEVPVERGSEQGEYRTIVAVARCDASSRVIFVECALSYTAHHHDDPASSWFHEFSFSITVVSNDGSAPAFTTQDRRIAREYLPDECIPLIMPIVISSLNSLVRRVRPKALYRVAKNSYLITKSMPKHNLITNALYNLGYSMIQSGTDPMSRPFWVMKR